MRAEIKLLHQKVGKTTVYVTHDQIEALTLADRVVVMNQGRIEQQGRPMDLYNKPANLFVAGFIGSPAMNFLDATAGKTSASVVARLKDGTEINLGADYQLADGQKIIVGLRPEHIGSGKGSETLRGKVRLIEPAGAQTFVIFEAAEQSLTVVVDSEMVPMSIEQFDIRFDRNRIHLFDPDTQQRIGIGSGSSR
jgi:multiple sugar transport system ATP-binding protein